MVPQPQSLAVYKLEGAALNPVFNENDGAPQSSCLYNVLLRGTGGGGVLVSAMCSAIATDQVPPTWFNHQS